MKQYLLIASLLLIAAAARTQTVFERLYPGVHRNYGKDVAVTGDSGFIVCGSDWGNNGSLPDAGMTLIKTDKYGTWEWTKKYYQSGEEMGFSVLQTSDGGYITGGFTATLYEYPIVVRTDSAGTQLWKRIYPYKNYDSFIRSLCQSPDGGFGFCETFMTGNGGTGVVAVRLTASGDTVWQKQLSGTVTEFGYAILSTPDSGFLLFSGNATTSFLRKVDKNGNVVLDKQYNGLGGTYFAQAPDGGFILCGNTTYLGMQQVAILRTDANGDSLWSKRITMLVTANSVCCAAGGGYVVGGTQMVNWTTDKLILLRFSDDGDLLWTRLFFGSGYDEGNAVRPTPDGGIIFAGNTKKTGTDSIMVCLVKAVDDTTLTGIPKRTTASLTLYPNPAKDFINILLPEGISSADLTVSTMQGKSVLQKRIGSGESRVDLEGFVSGMYFIVIREGDLIYRNRIITY
jgi:hypothetical protein